MFRQATREPRLVALVDRTRRLPLGHLNAAHLALVHYRKANGVMKLHPLRELTGPART